MKYGISLPPFGDFADVRYLAETAHAAEAAGWDGFFIWDHVIFDPSFHPIAPPWVALTAVAMRTERMKIGAMITPLPRRRPWNFARETAAVDHLSNGRLIIGVGIGDPVQWDYGFFGEDQDVKTRAAKLDEGLDVVTGLWSGQPFKHQGTHYHLEQVTFKPTPAQQPRIPIWVGGMWNKPGPQRRAARWDGFIPLGDWGGDPISPENWRGMMDNINKQRTSTAPYEWVHSGDTPGDDPIKAAAMVRPYAEIGINWWIEGVNPWRFGQHWEDQWDTAMTRRMEERIQQGPPRL